MRRRKGITYNNQEAPSYENNFNFDQPLLKRPDYKVYSISPYYANPVALGFGQFFALEDNPEKNIDAGEIQTDDPEKARLRREQREAFDSMAIWNTPSDLELANREIK
jgi:hypothetical protein